jgi:ornithine--oxo-acid transaminase
LIRDSSISAVYLEPNYYEGGSIIPDDGYLKKVYDLLIKYNCLLVTDVVKDGIRRTGYLNALE